LTKRKDVNKKYLLNTMATVNAFRRNFG
jgi:hypothetical protein